MSIPTARSVITVGLAVAIAVVSVQPVRSQDVLGESGLKGAGSTFAHPVLAKWSRDYRAWQSRGGEFPVANGGLDDPSPTTALEYEPVGSLAGTLRVQARAVDFGVSDMPMRSEELQTLGLVQFPIVMGGVVVAVNIEGIRSGELRLTGPLLAEVFLGRVRRWSDPSIKEVNPSLNLPDAPIAVVRRSDGSGTTFNFTDYLSKVSPDWKQKVGAGLLVQWPTGTASKGNEGVAERVKATRNSIGYVEFAQAALSKLDHALVQNRAGAFVKPDSTGFQAAAAAAQWNRTRDFYVLLTDAPGRTAYPIAATVFVLMRKDASPARTSATLEFFRWSLEQGSRTASQLGYVPLPADLSRQVSAYWSANLPARRR